MHVHLAEAEAELLPLINTLMTPVLNAAFSFWMKVVVYCSMTIMDTDHNPQPLYYAASYRLKETIKLLLSQGADLNARGGGFGGTALHAACYRRHPDIARILLNAGSDIRIKDYNGMTSIELTLWSEDSDIAKVLLEEKTVGILDDTEKSNLVAISLRKSAPVYRGPSGFLRRREDPGWLGTSTSRQGLNKSR